MKFVDKGSRDSIINFIFLSIDIRVGVRIGVTNSIWLLLEIEISIEVDSFFIVIN